jgi:hypothetical protein
LGADFLAFFAGAAAAAFLRGGFFAGEFCRTMPDTAVEARKSMLAGGMRKERVSHAFKHSSRNRYRYAIENRYANDNAWSRVHTAANLAHSHLCKT